MQRTTRSRILIALVHCALSANIAFAQDKPKLDTKAQQEAPTAFAGKEPQPILDWGKGEGKSYLVPAAEVAGFELLLNRFDHSTIDSIVYGSPLDNFRENLHHRWVVDNDAFSTN